MEKRSRPQSAHRVEEENLTTAVERSSGQVINPPRKKKKKRSRKRRRRLKSSALRRQPASPQLRVRGRKCTVQAFIYKRLPLQGQVTKLKNCYRGWKAARTLPKAANSGQSNSSLVPVDGKKLPRKEKGEHSAKPSVSNLQEKQRRSKKKVSVEKKRYQSLSEYQFICPGKAVFQCTRQNVKQRLRSIYMGEKSQKVPRSRHPSIRIPRSQWGINNPQRGNPTTDSKCPIGSDFPRNTNSRGIPLGVSSLTYQINKLLLAGPEGTAVNCYAAHRQQQPALEKATPEEEGLQQLSRSPTRQGEEGGWCLDPGYNLESQHRRTTTKARSQNPTRPRPMSAKECYRNAWNHLFGGEGDHSKEDLEKEDAEENMPELSADRKAAIIQTRSAIIVPTIAPYSSNESLAAEGPPCNAADSFCTKMKQHGHFHPGIAQSKPGEMLTGSLAHERGLANDFTALQSKRFEALGMGAWSSQSGSTTQFDHC